MAAVTKLSPVTSVFRCPGCSASIWSAFASSLRPTTTLTRPRRLPAPSSLPKARWLQTSRAVRSDERTAQQDLDRLTDDVLEKQEAALEQPAQEEDDPEDTPWYLQEQPARPQPDVNPFAERQRIPELPESPPSILQPLLQQISVDLGLDYLTVLDLRHLNDPPPAFGANLIMLIGSARGDKHLNVSADRLCRWLRSNYNLAPKADGLLGRNELKLKMRRKAKRSRIMNAAGGGGQIPDDGTNTGWICVNVGTVEGGLLPDAETDPSERPGFVGFSTGAKGAKIVVQMMTEDKRAEIDLEGLWQDIIETQARRQAGTLRAKEKEEEITEREESAQAEAQSRRALENVTSSGYTPRRRRRVTGPAHTYDAPYQPRQQMRRFHTSARKMTMEQEVESSLDDVEAVRESVAAMRLRVQRSVPSSNMSGTAQDSGEAAIKHHWTYIKSAPPEEAISSLGMGQDDRSSTPFLQSYYGSLPAFRSHADFRFGILLHCHAIDIGHPSYTRFRLLLLLREAQTCMVYLSRELLLRCLRTTLQAHNVIPITSNETTDDPRKESHAILRRVVAYSKEIFEIMESYDHSLREKDIYIGLFAAITDPQFSHPNTPIIPQHLGEAYKTVHSPEQLQKAYHTASISPDHVFTPKNELTKSLLNTINVLYRPTLSPHNITTTTTTPTTASTNDTPTKIAISTYDAELYHHILTHLALEGNFSDFNKIFADTLPKHFLRRDAYMYTLFFGMQAMHGTVREEVQRAVVRGWGGMGVEVPPVVLGGFGGSDEGEGEGEWELARAIRRCLIRGGVEREGWGRPYDEVWRRVDEVLGADFVEQGEGIVGEGVESGTGDFESDVRVDGNGDVYEAGGLWSEHR